MYNRTGGGVLSSPLIFGGIKLADTEESEMEREMTERKVAGRYLLQSLAVGISYFLDINDITNLILLFDWMLCEGGLRTVM